MPAGDTVHSERDLGTRSYRAVARAVDLFPEPDDTPHYRIALPVDWFNIFLLGLTLYWNRSTRAKTSPLPMILRQKSLTAVVRRIVVPNFCTLAARRGVF